MGALWPVALVLVCPVVMGAMMIWMRRGEAAVATSDSSQSEEAPRRRLPGALPLVQLLALVFVALLLALLVWKVAQGSSGAGLVAAIKRGDRPSHRRSTCL